MFLHHAITQLQLCDRPVKALDLCAAPGGKSTLLNSLLHPDSFLLSNEIIKSRAKVLSDNLMRWGYPNVAVTNNDPSTFKHVPGYFDLLVVDAPCSGSGMFHKDHSAIDEWSLANVRLCSERQQRILANSLSTLAENGILFYSTCSYSREENEEIVDWLIEEFGMESIAISIDEAWGIQVTESSRQHASGYRFYPHKVKGEGLFFAALRKTSAQSGFTLKKAKGEKNDAPQNIAGQWLDMTDLYSFQHEDFLHVFPKMYEQDLNALRRILYFKEAGTMIGRYFHKELVPSHDLAMSVRVRNDLPQLELDRDTALRYLHKDTLDSTINKEQLMGWILVTYGGANLGWIKAMPNRINNYYPKEARIAVL
ncbi:MAG TPA: RNA methyltransferase, partial [Sphingobacterium sp.]|nr:RNA methyltransferase [Sphingobacterium sp.]